MLGRALLLRCPRCGSSGLFRGWLTLNKQCPRCNLLLQRGEGDHWLGGYAFNLVLSELVWAASMVTILIVRWPDVPWDFLQYGGVALMIAAPFIFFPFSRTLWLAIDLMVRPEREDRAGPAE
jgi:uncharacterized protein (DUF983 family)